MKYLSILLFFIPLFSSAQEKSLQIEGTSPTLYLNHTVVAKENFYSVGRMYNSSPKESIAPFNNLDLNKGLALGQVVKVPLTATNFLQSGSPAAGEVLIPVYHTVKEKEGLARISANYNKVPIATLKKWNKLSSDAVNNGTNLIVGYLMVKKDLSPLASRAVETPDMSADATVSEPVVTQTTKPVKPTPVVKDVKKEDVVVTKPVKKDEPIKQEVKQEEKKQEVKNTEEVSTEVVNTTGADFKGGIFKNEYDKQINNKDLVKESGTAATFKSTSGWEDGKYYCMHNTATPGTIIKITNNNTGKSVYAKVLDVVLPDIKQNNGLLVRLSNAAAEGLGITDENKFDCTLEYAK